MMMESHVLAATHPTAVTAHAVLAAGVPAIGACLGLWGDGGTAAVVHDGQAGLTHWMGPTALPSPWRSGAAKSQVNNELARTH